MSMNTLSAKLFLVAYHGKLKQFQDEEFVVGTGSFVCRSAARVSRPSVQPGDSVSVRYASRPAASGRICLWEGRVIKQLPDYYEERLPSPLSAGRIEHIDITHISDHHAPVAGKKRKLETQSTTDGQGSSTASTQRARHHSTSTAEVLCIADYEDQPELKDVVPILHDADLPPAIQSLTDLLPPALDIAHTPSNTSVIDPPLTQIQTPEKISRSSSLNETPSAPLDSRCSTISHQPSEGTDHIVQHLSSVEDLVVSNIIERFKIMFEPLMNDIYELETRISLLQLEVHGLNCSNKAACSSREAALSEASRYSEKMNNVKKWLDQCDDYAYGENH